MRPKKIVRCCDQVTENMEQVSPEKTTKVPSALGQKSLLRRAFGIVKSASPPRSRSSSESSSEDSATAESVGVKPEPQQKVPLTVVQDDEVCPMIDLRWILKAEAPDCDVTVEAENLKKHLGLREKSFVTLSEKDQAEVGGRLKELLHIVSDGAIVPLLNWCTEECHVRKLCALKGIITLEDVVKVEPKEEPKDEPEEDMIDSDSDVDERMAEADADIKAQV